MRRRNLIIKRVGVMFTLAFLIGQVISSGENVYAADVQARGNSKPYGTTFRLLEGDLTRSGLGTDSSRPAILDRWEAYFTENLVSNQQKYLDKYDNYDIQKMLKSDDFGDRNGYGLLPIQEDVIKRFVQEYTNGNPDYVWEEVSKYGNYETDYGYYTLDRQDYVLASQVVSLSGGILDKLEKASGDKDPSEINGTVYFLTSPWPKIASARIESGQVVVDFTTYGQNNMHDPTVIIFDHTLTKTVTYEYGKTDQKIFHDVLSKPVSQVENELGSLNDGPWTVVVRDGYGRTESAVVGESNPLISYVFGSNYSATYTPAKPAVFNKDLALALTSDVGQLSANNDTLSFSYSIDGGAYQPLTVATSKVFDGSGSIKQNITLSRDILNGIPGRTWGQGTHNIKIKVSATSGDAYQYAFSSADSGQNKPEATVTVTFTPEADQARLPGANQIEPLKMRFVDLPEQVPFYGNFTATVEISNDGYVDLNPSLDFVLDGIFTVKREIDNPDGTVSIQYLQYPLKEKKSYQTSMGHTAVWWKINSGVTYEIEGYNYKPGDTDMAGRSLDGGTQEDDKYILSNKPLNVGGPPPDEKTGKFPNYAVKLTVTARDPEDFLEPQIQTYVGVYMAIKRPKVHLVE